VKQPPDLAAKYSSLPAHVVRQYPRRGWEVRRDGQDAIEFVWAQWLVVGPPFVADDESPTKTEGEQDLTMTWPRMN
jgi:hypothetical protein